MSVLLTQLLVTTGLTALSVQGVRSAHALAGQSLELVEQGGAKTLRVAGDSAAPADPKTTAGDGRDLFNDVGRKAAGRGEPTSAPTNSRTPEAAAHTEANGAPAGGDDPAPWLTQLEQGLTPDEHAKWTKMKAGKSPQQVRDTFGADQDIVRNRVRAAVREDEERAVVALQSKERVADLKKTITDRGLMNDPDIQGIVNGTTIQDPVEQLSALRDKLMAKVLRSEIEHKHPGAEVLDGVKIYERLPEKSLQEWRAKYPGKEASGITSRDDGLYIQRGEMDLMVIERQPSGRAKVVEREEIKTGTRDTHADARDQLDDQTDLLRHGAAGSKAIRLEVAGRDITGEIDLHSDAAAPKRTRGPARKGFEESLGVSAADLEKMCKGLLAEAAGTKGNP